MSEREHQLLLDAVKDHAIFMIDPQGCISSWNEGARRLKGFDEEEVIGRHFRMLFLPEDRHSGRPEQELAEALHTGRSEEEWWRQRKDGSRFWAHVILQPIFDEGGAHIGFAKVTTDRTEQKRLDELNEFLMNEAAAYAIFLLDRGGRIAKWSRAAERILGFSGDEALGKTLDLFALSNDHPLNGNGHPPGKEEAEGWKRRKDGSQFWAATVITPLHNGNGSVVMLQDLTEKQAFEQATRSNIALTASNTELERFAYVVSHDLKEPARKISTFCGMLEAHTPQQEALVRKIRGASAHMLRLIEDILDFSSMARKQQPAEEDLNEIVACVLEDLDEFLRTHKASVEVTPLPKTRVIRSQVEQLFQNLISNAVKFCCLDEQKPEVRISSRVIAKEALPHHEREALQPSEHYLQLHIRDNGIGFEQRFSEGIFDLFKRLHSRAEYEGTGVGLSICKKVAENHGGRIEAFSEKGKGALFVVTLPYDSVA